MNDLISVIIPIYNVESYIIPCVQSVLQQTYYPVEILLIDDGSTDNSGKICDILEEHYSAVKTIHKENGGLSSARNKGISIAKGSYIFFLDGDDTISLDCLQYLKEYMDQKGSDISIGAIKEIYGNDIPYDSAISKYKLNSECISNVEALKKMLYMKDTTNSACGKLYKKELFNTISFPEGKLYEDLGTVYLVMSKATRITITDKYIYYYLRSRDNSIMNQEFNSKRIQGYVFCHDILKFVSQRFPQIINSAVYRLYFECVWVFPDIPKSKQYHKIRKKIWADLITYRRFIMKDSNAAKTIRIMALFTYLNQDLFSFIWKLVQKIYYMKKKG